MDEDEIQYEDLPWRTKLSVKWNWLWYYRVTRNREQLLLWFVGHLPREVAYRAAIRVIADATTGAYSKQNVPELYAMDAIQRWPERKGGDRTNRKTRDEHVYLTEAELGMSHKDERRAYDLAVAICHTVDYIGTDTLPALPGWSWFDVLDAHYPEMAQQYIKGRVGEKGGRCSSCHSMQTLRYGVIRPHSDSKEKICSGSGCLPLDPPLNVSKGE